MFIISKKEMIKNYFLMIDFISIIKKKDPRIIREYKKFLDTENDRFVYQNKPLGMEMLY